MREPKYGSSYERLVQEDKHCSFTPLVMSLTHGLEWCQCLLQVACLHAVWEMGPQHPSLDKVHANWPLSFSLLHNQCIHGAHSTSGHALIQAIDSPTDLRHTFLFNPLVCQFNCLSFQFITLCGSFSLALLFLSFGSARHYIFPL